MSFDPTQRFVARYAAWHDEARSLKGKMPADQIAKKFGASPSSMAHILSDNWKTYVLYKRLYRIITIPECRAALKHPKCGISFEHSKVHSARNDVKIREQPMGRLRLFEQVSEFREGKTLKGARIVCSSCEAHQEYYNHQGTVSTEHLEKEFARKGWYVGATNKKDICPTCRDRRTHKNTVHQLHIPEAINRKAEETMTINVKPTIVSSEPTTNVPAVIPPKAMDRTERRLVFAKLNEVYMDETSGYSEDWTDAKVAADLGVPVAWVSEVRDADFGPEVNASILADRSKEVIALGEKMERTIVLIDKKIEALQSLDTKVSAASEEIVKLIDRFEVLCKSLETEDKHIEGLMNAFKDDTAEFKKLFAELRGQPSN